MSKPPRASSLFDVEDVEQMPKVRDMQIAPVAANDVREFTRRYHYTGMPGNPAWRWGLWHGPVLHGVVAYGPPIRSAAAAVFGEEHADRVIHMSRLALAESSPRNSESRLIGGSLRAIEKDHPDIWAVLTYAATSVGHIGTVYQATNALYTGTGGEPYHYVDVDGYTRSSYTTHHEIGGVRHGRVAASDARARGWKRVPSGPKHRYIYILGTRRQRRERREMLRYTVLPYPKVQTTTPTAISGNGSNE